MRKRPGAQSAAANSALEQTLPYRALLMQAPTHLKLVIVGGVPIFGEPALMARLLLAAAMQTETITVCGESRVINVQAGTFYTSTPWSATAENLRDALASLRIQLADFVECC